VSDLINLKSHPDKVLLTHIDGVITLTKKLTNSRFAELVAIFHDLGKINPNFQSKFDPTKKVGGYSNHSYLSAYAFFCAFCCNRKNTDILRDFLDSKLTKNDIIALSVIIAKHHGNLPDFTPTDYNGSGTSILSIEENRALFSFLEMNQDLPVFSYVNYFFPIVDFKHYLINSTIQQGYTEKFIFDGYKNENPLDFFISYQSIFASLLQADKADAGHVEFIIDKQREDLKSFSYSFSSKLSAYLRKLDQNTDLNILRTEIREMSIRNIQNGLSLNKHIFELTAPTGSGKTLMLLSLASEIIEQKGPKRIIYSLPFLSITEQIEEEVLKICKGEEEWIRRIDSKSDYSYFEKIQEALDTNPTEELIKQANIIEFQESTFAYPFVITTFVRFFETLLSNKNSDLLKLPNFSNSIFLLDEIQALPPRLYGFFVAYLAYFCEKFDSYAIISSATQPNFELPSNSSVTLEFFKFYEKPFPLLPLSYFNCDIFNRYQIEIANNPISLEKLKDYILQEKSSILIILNTIADTTDLFRLLLHEYNEDEVLLLNTHFTPRHRKIKIYLAKRRLRENKHVILISTQLIEAGVDIDFPVLYRDYATISSIVQSAGRCNRNGRLNGMGRISLFTLQRNGKSRSDLIYRGKDKYLIDFTKNSFKNSNYQEKELIQVQRDFFQRIQSELCFARHWQKCPDIEFDFLTDIKECMFEKIGNFRLIDDQLYGEELQYYVPWNDDDDSYEILLKHQTELIVLFKESDNKSVIRAKKKLIELHLKKMANQIVQIRLKDNKIIPMLGSGQSYFNLYKIDSKFYSFFDGINLDRFDYII